MVTILFITIGAGLGHLTRGLAVARQITKLEEKSNLIFFTTTDAAEVIEGFGYSASYMPKHNELPNKIKALEYNQWMGNVLHGIMENNHIDCIIFDGAFPYQCIVSLLHQNESVNKVWLKREGDRMDYNVSSLNQYKQLFDLVIIPDEFGLMNKRKLDHNEVRVPPIMLLEYDELLKREEVRKQVIGLDKDDLLYVQLGNAKRVSKYDQLNLVIEELLKLDHSMILLGQPVDGPDIALEHPKIVNIKRYPNAQLFLGIDYAITSAGYNTVHELAYCKVPSIFIPNLSVVKDDQLERARRVEAIGGAITLTDMKDISRYLQMMQANRTSMKQHFEQNSFINGSKLAAEYLLNLKKRFQH